MVTSVGVYFVKPEDYDTNFEESRLFRDESLRYAFQGYIDEAYRHYQLVDEEQGLYRETVFSALLEFEGKSLSDIEYERIFQICTYAEDDYREDESHHTVWLGKFRQAKQSDILILIFE